MTSSVLHVSHHMPPHIGGLEVVLEAEARGLQRRGWTVTVLSSAHDVSPGSYSSGGMRAVRVWAWNGLEGRFGVPFPVFAPRILNALRREVRRADVVHVHDILYVSSWVAALWCVLLRTPYVVHRHVGLVHHSSVLVRLVQRLVVESLGRLTLRGAHAVLAIDEHVADAVRPSLGSAQELVVLRNGVDTDAFSPVTDEQRRRTREAYGLPTDRCLALFVGRFVPKKGFDVVAAASDPAYEIVFVGGDRPEDLDDPRLHFLGGLPTQDMPAVYACADVMVVASVGECPLTVLEAMSSGLPLLANDDPGLHSPWTDGPGVRWVAMADGGLSGALRELAASPDERRRLGEEGLEAAQQWSWGTHVSRLEQVYRRALRGHRAA